MKTISIYILLTIAVIFTASNIIISKEVNYNDEKWVGYLNVGTSKISVAFEITNGRLVDSKVFFHIAEQKSFYNRGQILMFDNDSIIIKLPRLKSLFSGKLINDSIIDGSIKQGNDIKGINLTLTKTNNFNFKIEKRPQEPLSTNDYIEEEISFKNSKENIILKGTITKQRENKKYKAIVLISGSGPSDRDQNIFGHKTFLVWADYLTKRGYLVLRYDDRGAGESQGNYIKATIKDHAEDASFAIDYLLTRPDVDQNGIVIIGHSLGAEIASLCVNTNKNARGLVLMAGAAKSLEEIIYKQCDLIFTKNGVSKEGISINQEIISDVIQISKSGLSYQDKVDKVKANIETYQKKVDKMSIKDKELLEYNTPLDIKQFRSLLQPFMQYDLSFDPSVQHSKVKVPTLILHGSSDIQVPVENLYLIENIIKSNGNRNVKIKEFKGRNHLFQKSIKNSVEEYGEIEETIDYKVLDIIAAWIKKNFNN